MQISEADMQAAREYCINSGHPYGSDIRLVAEAVARERERCAKIAEGFKALDGEEDAPVYRARTVGNAIAVTIRSGARG